MEEEKSLNQEIPLETIYRYTLQENARLKAENEQEYRFKPANQGQFRYYRFEFIRMADGTRLQLSEIKLYK